MLYLLGNDATGIREVSRSNADFSIKRVGSSLVVDNDTDGQFTLVLSAMDGRIVRSLNACSEDSADTDNLHQQPRSQRPRRE